MKAIPAEESDIERGSFNGSNNDGSQEGDQNEEDDEEEYYQENADDANRESALDERTALK